MLTVFYSSPLGILEIVTTQTHITAIKFVDHTQNFTDLSDIHSLQTQCFKELDEYFGGNRQAFTLPISQKGTPFQKEVWNNISTIPYGKTVSYAQLSQKLGDIKKIRAVGSSNGRNNLAIVVPCHRVIGSNNQLIGYAGGLWRKQWLLDHEAKFGYGVEQMKLI